MKQTTNELIASLESWQIEKINEWLPKKALSNKGGIKKKDGQEFTSIEPWSVTDRLNGVFGINGWHTDCDIVSIQDGMVLVKLVFEVPAHGIHHTTFGGNNNRDLGDAAKGAETDALTKVASWLGIGTGIWRGEYSHLTPQREWDARTDEGKAKVAAARAFYEANPDAKAKAAKSKGRESYEQITDGEMLDIYTALVAADKIKPIKQIINF